MPERHQHEGEQQKNALLRGYNIGKRALQGSIIALELLPTNEMIRYGALAYALANTDGGALVGAAVLGGTTLAVEGTAALATADLMTTDVSERTIQKVNKVVDKVFPRGVKMNALAEVGVAMVGGSAVVLAEKQREDPSRTKKQNRKHGAFTAAWMAGYFSLEGAFIGANTESGNILSAKSIGALALALGISWGGAKIALRRNRKQNLEE